MKRIFKHLITLLLTLLLILGATPILSDAKGSRLPKKFVSDHVFTEAENALLDNDVFAKITALTEQAAQTMGGLQKMTEADFIRLIPDVRKAIESSDTYVKGTLQQKGYFLVWETTVGMPCCYSPRMEALLHGAGDTSAATEGRKTEIDADAFSRSLRSKAGLDLHTPTSIEIGLIQPFWESNSSYADSNFCDYSPNYKATWQSLSQATGGSQNYRFSMKNATVDNIAKAVQNCGLVIFDSHGDTDYEGSNYDYTSRANTSYLCLSTTTGITTADTQRQTGTYGTYYNAMKSYGYGYVNGTCIANHMTQNAPESLVYMGICLGMATDGMHKGLRQKGVEAVYGYSQSVTFDGEQIYMLSIMGYLKDGDNFAEAIRKTKQQYGNWDPAYQGYSLSAVLREKGAFPIVVSSEDAYPGHGNVDAVQTVCSTWELYPAAPGEESYTVTFMANGTVCSTEEVRKGSSLNLPASAPAPAGWTFLGWSENESAESESIPSHLAPGAACTPDGDKTFYALYTRTADLPLNECRFTLVTKAPENWEGRYVITTDPLSDTYYVLKGISGTRKYESLSAGGSVTFAQTGFSEGTSEGTYLTNVSEAYIFDVKKAGGGYSIQNEATGTYLASRSSLLYSLGKYQAAFCTWSLEMQGDAVVSKNASSLRYPYLCFSRYFQIGKNVTGSIRFWKLSETTRTTYATNVN